MPYDCHRTTRDTRSLFVHDPSAKHHRRNKTWKGCTSRERRSERFGEVLPSLSAMGSQFIAMDVMGKVHSDSISVNQIFRTLVCDWRGGEWRICGEFSHTGRLQPEAVHRVQRKGNWRWKNGGGTISSAICSHISGYIGGKAPQSEHGAEISGI